MTETLAPTAPPTSAELGLTPALLQAAAGWLQPTAVQGAAIPPILQGRNLLAEAPTGAGKTAAFVLRLLQRLLAAPAEAPPRQLRALVLTPTCELAAQTARVLRTLAPQLRAVLAFGGPSINPQIQGQRIRPAASGRRILGRGCRFRVDGLNRSRGRRSASVGCDP